MPPVYDLHKLRIGTSGKQFVVLKLRPYPFQLHILRPVHKYHSMGIPHGHAGHMVLQSLHTDGNIHSLTA